MIAPLDPARARVAERVLDEESARRTHVVVALSGSHGYGFASPTSDLDLKGVHIDPTASLLRLVPPGSHVARLGDVDGVTVDYSSNELHAFLRGVLQGNGNLAERVLC